MGYFDYSDLNGQAGLDDLLSDFDICEECGERVSPATGCGCPFSWEGK